MNISDLHTCYNNAEIKPDIRFLFDLFALLNLNIGIQSRHEQLSQHKFYFYFIRFHISDNVIGSDKNKRGWYTLFSIYHNILKTLLLLCSTSPGSQTSRSPPHPWPQPSQPGAGLACVTEETGGGEEPVNLRQGNSVYGRKNPWGNHSYADLISQAISSSAERRMTLSQIYDWMVANIPYFTDRQSNSKSAGWKVKF